MLANTFQAVAMICLGLFAFAIWPPLVLLVAALTFGGLGVALENDA